MRLPSVVHSLRAPLSALLVAAGAAVALAGALAPWAEVRLFRAFDLSLSGLFFADGALCLAVAVLILLRMRRSPLLCLAGAVLSLFWVQDARVEVPRRVKHQVVGAGMALSPINRLLDQFHVGDIDVASYTIPDAQLLGPGLDWAEGGALLLLGGSLLGLPGDPLVVWVYGRTARAGCRACGARWPLSRQAVFCPQCGASLSPVRRCAACLTPAAPRDHHCIACGAMLPA